MKTNKSYKKRLKVTKNGKILARKPGQCHFNAKESGKKRAAKRNMSKVAMPQRTQRRFLAGLK